MYLFNSALQEQHRKINLFVVYLFYELFCVSEDVPSPDMSQIHFCVLVCEIPTHTPCTRLETFLFLCFIQKVHNSVSTVLILYLLSGFIISLIYYNINTKYTFQQFQKQCHVRTALYWVITQRVVAISC